MKHRISIAIMCVVFMVMLCSCGKAESDNTQNADAADTSSFVEYDFNNVHLTLDDSWSFVLRDDATDDEKTWFGTDNEWVDDGALLYKSNAPVEAPLILQYGTIEEGMTTNTEEYIENVQSSDLADSMTFEKIKVDGVDALKTLQSNVTEGIDLYQAVVFSNDEMYILMCLTNAGEEPILMQEVLDDWSFVNK